MVTTHEPASGAPEMAAPIMMAFGGPVKQLRVTVLFRLILVIPQAIVLAFVAIAALVVLVIGWFGALFTGRLPSFAAEFLTGVLRWQMRVSGYQYLMTDRYPPFGLQHDDAYPIWLAAQPGRLNRWSVLWRLPLVLPASILAYIVQSGGFTIVAFIAWCIVLISGRMPPSLYLAYAASLRYQARVGGYALMLTSEWPWGLFGDKETLGVPGSTPGSAGYVAAQYGAPSAYGAPAYGAPQYGAAPAYAPPTGQPVAPPSAFGTPPVAAPTAPTAPAAPTAPRFPGVTFTFGGPSYLWGYSDDRSLCGIWSATDLSAPPQTWPIGEQGEAWTSFWQREPQAAAFEEPTTTPTVAPWSSSTGVTTAAPAPSYPVGVSPYASGGSYPAMGSAYPSMGSPHEPARSALPESGYTYPTKGTAADDPRWRLILAEGAKPLMVVFIVLGVLIGGLNVVLRLEGHQLQDIVAKAQVETAYDSLSSSVSSYETNITTCTGSLSCATGTSRTLGQAFGVFVGQVDRVRVPNDAAAAETALITVGSKAQSVFDQLGAAGSVTRYEQILQSNESVLRTFTQAYQHLLTQL